MKFKENTLLDLICLGRAGIDLNPNEINCKLEDVVTFTKTVGGSPANIAATASILGAKTGFIGRVSNDGLGKSVVKYFKSVGVDTSFVLLDKKGGLNGIAIIEIVSPDDNGSILYRENVADLNLCIDDISEDYLAASKILLVSGTALSREPSRSAVLHAMSLARKNSTKVIIDLDYRPYIWENEKEARNCYQKAVKNADIIIGNDLEYKIIDDYVGDALARKLLNQGAELVIIKHGENGSSAYENNRKINVGVSESDKIKSFGAGDAFAGTFIWGVVNCKTVEESLQLGAIAAAVVVGKRYCSASTPSLEKVINKNKTNPVKIEIEAFNT